MMNIKKNIANVHFETTTSKNIDCSEQPNLINDSHIVCTNCGTVNGYLTANEYVDFHENRHRMRRKSITWNIMLRIFLIHYVKSMVSKLVMWIGKGHIIFKLIDKVLSQVNGDRKRMISIKFILWHIFTALGMEYKFIPLSKSKQTLKY